MGRSRVQVPSGGNLGGALRMEGREMGAWAGTVATCRRDRLLSWPSLVSPAGSCGRRGRETENKGKPSILSLPPSVSSHCVGKMLEPAFPLLALGCQSGLLLTPS